MIDVRRFATDYGAAGVLAEFQDAGGQERTPLQLVSGTSESWELLCASTPDWKLVEAALALRPSVLVGVVRGACRGAAVRLAGELDLVYGVDPLQVDARVEFVEVGDEDSIRRLLDDLEADLHAVGAPASITAALLRGGVHRSLSDGLLAEALAYSMLQTSEEFAAWIGARHADA